MTRPASAKRRSLLGILAAGTICAAPLPLAALPAHADSLGNTGKRSSTRMIILKTG